MPSYARGSLAWGACQRCGLRYLLNDLLMDGYFPNIRVCEGCYDAPQPQERLAIVSDPQALWKPALDGTALTPIFLRAQVTGGHVALTWSSISGQSAQLSAGYQVSRSIDAVTWTLLATLMNTTDDFGALSIETLTFTDTTPPAGTIYYSVRGFDVSENAADG